MEDSLDGKPDRSARFDEAMGKFLPNSRGPTELQGHSVNGAADHIFYIDGRCIVIRVDYTQISRWHVKIWRGTISSQMLQCFYCVSWVSFLLF